MCALQKLQKGDTVGSKVAGVDLLDPQFLKALEVMPEERNAAHIEDIVSNLHKIAEGFFDHLSEDQQYDVARCCVYQHFAPNTTICQAEFEADFFYLVLNGEAEVEERQVSHQEGSAAETIQMRVTKYRKGQSFGDFPFIMQAMCYGYSAKVIPHAPC